MNGTEKQIKWAEDIKRDFIEQITGEITGKNHYCWGVTIPEDIETHIVVNKEEHEGYLAMIKRIENQDSATKIIKAYQTQVLAKFKPFCFEEDIYMRFYFNRYFPEVA